MGNPIEDTQVTPGESRTGRVRGNWDSRIAFYFASVGAAVGFGNVWRFPALCYSYGGGAFLIPYVIALFVVGIPILLLETAFGQYFQTGDVGVFGGFNPRFRGVGVASITCGFMLCTYYSMLIAWVANAFFDSFYNPDPWTTPEGDGSEAVSYFVGTIVGAETVDPITQRPTRMVGKNVGYSFLMWLIVFLGIGFGVQWTGRITYFTMGLPIVLMFVFLGTAVNLEGSEIGIHEYIGEWDVSVLREQGDVWSTAVTQIFFSVGITFGIMTAYASYCPRNEPVFVNALVVAFSDSLFSFISGFAVFAALGHLSFVSGKDVDDIGFSGFGLVFGTWPVILGKLPGGIHWARLLFVDLFLLGIDSAFGLAEAVVTILHDTVRFEHTPKWVITGVVCLLAWLFSILYACDAGLNFLDVIDFYINFTMLIVGFFETFAAGWVYDIAKICDAVGKPAVFCYMTGNFGSVILACGLWFGLEPERGAVWAGFVALIGFYLYFMVFTLYFLQQKMKEEPGKWTWRGIIWELSFKNIFDLKDRIEPTVRYIPSLWCYLIKQFLPHIMIILFVNLAQTPASSGKAMVGGYGGYPTRPYQVLGILTFCYALFLLVINFAFPQVYAIFALPEGHPSLEYVEETVQKEDNSSEDHSDKGQKQEDVTPEKPSKEAAAPEQLSDEAEA